MGARLWFGFFAVAPRDRDADSANHLGQPNLELQRRGIYRPRLIPPLRFEVAHGSETPGDHWFTGILVPNGDRDADRHQWLGGLQSHDFRPEDYSLDFIATDACEMGATFWKWEDMVNVGGFTIRDRGNNDGHGYQLSENEAGEVLFPMLLKYGLKNNLKP